MAHIFETRCTSEALSRSDSLFRVACIGDSMVWGQGVPARCTLPAHLDRLLNAALPDRLVWVDNFGQSSGNLWHAWSRMRARAGTQVFQAIVFSVCQNDTQIFESNSVEYDLDKLPYWRDDSLHLNHARRLFLDFKNFCDSHGILPLVIFYSYIQEDKPIIDVVERLTRELALPFIDMLSFYEQQTNITTATYIASEFDAHPSELAHELAARRVVTELLKYLDRSQAGSFQAGSFYDEPDRMLGNALTDLVEQRVSPEVALGWAEEALAAKERAAHRRHRAAEGSHSAVCAQLRERVTECGRAWRLARRIEACVRAANLQPDYWTVTLPNLYDGIRNLEEAVFLVENCASLAELAKLGEALVKDRFYEQSNQLAFFQGDVLAEIARARNRLGEMRMICPGRIEPSARDWLGKSGVLRNSLDPSCGCPEIAFAVAAAERLRVQLSAVELAGARFGSFINEIDARRIWAMIFLLVKAVLYYLWEVDSTFSRVAFVDAPTGSPWTCIDVVVEGGPDAEVVGEYCRLLADADYVVPRRGRVREVLWAGVKKDRAVYHFEIPLMIFGDLQISIPENDPTRERFLKGTTRISQVSIYNSPAAIIDTSRQADADHERPRETSSGVSQFTVEWIGDGTSRLPVIEFPRVLIP